MWYQVLKEKYSEETLEKFEVFMLNRYSQFIVNNVTGKRDWFFPTLTVQNFERMENINNSERCFPQK